MLRHLVGEIEASTDARLVGNDTEVHNKECADHQREWNNDVSAPRAGALFTLNTNGSLVHTKCEPGSHFGPSPAHV